MPDVMPLSRALEMVAQGNAFACELTSILTGPGASMSTPVAREVASLTNELLREALAVVTSALAWVPCAERLPVLDQSVLIYLKSREGGFIYIAVLRDYASGRLRWYGDDNSWEQDEATHWMPLPEPPGA